MITLMVCLKNGLGDALPREALYVSSCIETLRAGEEVSFTYDEFLSEELYDTVLEGIGISGLVCFQKTGVMRWFEDDKDTSNKRVFRGDFRNDVIILKRER